MRRGRGLRLLQIWLAVVASVPSTRSSAPPGSPRARSLPKPGRMTSTAGPRRVGRVAPASSGATMPAVANSPERVNALASAREAGDRSRSAMASGIGPGRTRRRSRRGADQDRHDERQVERARVALDVERLLARHRGDPQEEATQALRHGVAPAGAEAGRPTTARNTSSSDGSPSSTATPRAPAPRARVPRRRASEGAGSTRTCSAGAERLHARAPRARRAGPARRRGAPCRGARRIRPGTQVSLSAAGVSRATSRPSTMRPIRAQYSASSR